MADNKEKHLRNEYGKEMRLGSKDMEFTTGNDDIKVNMTAEGVVTINSNRYLTIVSEDDMNIGYKEILNLPKDAPPNIPVKKISITAEEGIYLQRGATEDFLHGAILLDNTILISPKKVIIEGELNKAPEQDFLQEIADSNAEANNILKSIKEQKAKEKADAEAVAKEKIKFGFVAALVGVVAVAAII